MSEIVKCSEVQKDCKYWKDLNYHMKYCDYLEMEGCRRGCKPEECNKFVSKNKKE